MRRHRPIGSLKYPGPHFRLTVLLVVGDADADADADVAAEAAVTADGVCPDGPDDDDGETAIPGDDGGSVGKSEVFPLLAISASTIWTILSLLDGEYGSSNANAGEPVLTTDAVSTVVDDGA